MPPAQRAGNQNRHNSSGSSGDPQVERRAGGRRFATSAVGPVILILVAGPEYDTEIKQLIATMHTIEQVLDLPGMRSEIDDLGVQVAAPDLWDDQANATRVTGRLSSLQGQVERFEALKGRIEDLELMVELANEEGDQDSLAES